MKLAFIPRMPALLILGGIALLPLIAGWLYGQGTLRVKLLGLAVFAGMFGYSFVEAWVVWVYPLYMLGCYFAFFPSIRRR
jgi:hypothetical protein